MFKFIIKKLMDIRETIQILQIQLQLATQRVCVRTDTVSRVSKFRTAGLIFSAQLLINCLKVSELCDQPLQEKKYKYHFYLKSGNGMLIGAVCKTVILKKKMQLIGLFVFFDNNCLVLSYISLVSNLLPKENHFVLP